MSKDIIIDQIVDPEVGLISVDKLYRKLRSEGFARNIIDKAMKNMQTYQVNQSVNPKEYNTIASSFVGDVIQADLMDVSNISFVNNKVNFLLTFIDVYSRYVFVEKLKSKSMEEVSSAFENIIGKFASENITTDDGSEFNNVKLTAVMKKHKIKHWITPAYTPNKLAIIERFHRTLRNRMTLYFNYTRKERYVDVLDKLICNYNYTYHRTIETESYKILTEKRLTNKYDI